MVVNLCAIMIIVFKPAKFLIALTKAISVELSNALVASSKNGAYVHCWVWVENSVKPRRTRKKTV